MTIKIKTITKQDATKILPNGGEFVLLSGVKKINFSSLPRDVQQAISIYLGNGLSEVIVRKL